jgi:hypothetical protein
LPRRDRGQPSVLAKLLSIQDVLRTRLNIFHNQGVAEATHYLLNCSATPIQPRSSA